MKTKHFDILTLFPENLKSALEMGVVGQAFKKGIFEVSFINPRDFVEGTSIHRPVDDRPYGGGDGMVMLAEPLARAVEHNQAQGECTVIYLSPQGELLDDNLVLELSKKERLLLICGRYDGVDQRFINKYVHKEISIGDYILSGGELAALVLVDSIMRKVPHVLGNQDSVEKESFTENRLEGPLFTRPQSSLGMEVPEVFLSGHHNEIEKLKKALAWAYTALRRQDLLKKSMEDKLSWKTYLKSLDALGPKDLKSCGFKDWTQERAQLIEIIEKMGGS